MAIQNKSVTITGASTKLTSVTLYPQLDGSVVISAIGTASDGSATPVSLSEARLQATGVAALDNMVARALTELRKTNGLEV